MGGIIDQIQKGVAQIPVKPAYDFATGKMTPQDVQSIQQFPGQVDRAKQSVANAFRPAPMAQNIAPQIRR